MLYAFDGRVPEIGKDTYVSDAAYVIGDVVIGDECYIGPGAIIRGDYGSIRIGNRTAVEEGVIIHAQPGEQLTIGSNVTFGHGAIIHAHEIKDFAFFGMGCVVSLDSVIGSWTIIAEGAVVKQGQITEDGMLYVGTPAKAIRAVLDRDKDNKIPVKQLYVDLAKKYLTIGVQQVKI